MNHKVFPIIYWDGKFVVNPAYQIIYYYVMQEHPMIFAESESE